MTETNENDIPDLWFTERLTDPFSYVRNVVFIVIFVNRKRIDEIFTKFEFRYISYLFIIIYYAK